MFKLIIKLSQMSGGVIKNPLGNDGMRDVQRKLDALRRVTESMPRNNMFTTMQTVKSIFGEGKQSRELSNILQEIDRAFEITKTIDSDSELFDHIKRGLEPKMKSAVDIINTNKGDMVTSIATQNIQESLKQFLIINAKYRFYLYKYLQLNAFIPNFAFAVQSIQQDIFSNMTTVILYMHEQYKTVVENISRGLQEVLKSQELANGKNIEENIKRINMESARDMQAVLSQIVETTKQVEQASSAKLVSWIVREKKGLHEAILKELNQQPKP